jgi:tetratricopeptide (TPR) repeat protein
MSGQADPSTIGLQALDRKDYAQAEQAFSKLTVSDPHNYSALFNLALAETGLKETSKAMDLYRRVLAEKPGLYEAELNLGILLLREKQQNDALPLLRDAARQKPGEARPERYLGDALLAAEKPAEAADAYRAALKADPKMASAELGLGQAFLRTGQLDDAAAHYTQAAALDPSLKSFLLQLADGYVQANRNEQALPLLAQFPEDAGAREEAGRLYLASNRTADAVHEFEAAVSLSPTSANRLALAAAYLKNNKPNQAAPIISEALAADPNNYDLRMALGRIYRDKRDFPAAAREFSAAAKLKPDSVEAWNEATSVLVMNNQLPEALAALDQVRRLHGETPGDFFYRAMVLDKLRQIKPALENYRQFLAVSGGKFPDQEFIARQRSRILEQESKR